MLNKRSQQKRGSKMKKEELGPPEEGGNGQTQGKDGAQKKGGLRGEKLTLL